MKRDTISDRISIMHATKKTFCRYSGKTIEPGEIAFTISCTVDQERNRWIKLDHLQAFLNHLKDICNNPEKYDDTGEDEYFKLDKPSDRDIIYGFVDSTRKKCAYCETRAIEEPIFWIHWGKRKYPFIHEKCISDLAADTQETLEEHHTELASELL